MAAEQYVIPFAIDPKMLLTGLDQMDQGLTDITSKAKGATAAITESFSNGAKASQDFATKMDAGAKAVKSVSDAAKSVGVDIANAFSGNSVKTNEVQEKITQFIAKLRDVAGKPITFGFNLDKVGIEALQILLKNARTEMEGFNIILSSAKEKLATLAPTTSGFKILSQQIQEAEGFLNAMNDDSSVLFNLGEKANLASTKVSSLRKEIFANKEELARMEQAGLAGTAAFVELAKKTGDLKNQFSDTSQRIKNLSNDTKGLDAGIQAIRGLAGAFAISQGALTLFGDQNEEVAKTIAKVQGAMALLMGVQEVANVLNKDSALLTYINTFVVKARANAVIAETVAIEGEAAATVAATTATEGFTAALLLNPIVGIIALVAALSIALYKYGTATESADHLLKRLNEDLILNKEHLEENNGILQRSQSVQEANAQFLRKNQSDILAAQHDFLIKESDNQENQTIRLKKDADLAAANKKVSYDEYMKLRNAYIESFKESLNLEAKITVNEIQQQKQLQEEKVKLQADFIKDRLAEAAIEVEIAKHAQDFLNEIRQTRISELRDGEQKELSLLNQGLVEKIQNLNYEQKAQIKSLEDQRANLLATRELADTNGKIVIDNQVNNFTKQINLTKANGEVLKKLEIELVTQTEVEKKEVIKKYAEQRADIEFSVAQTELNLQQESGLRQVKIIELTAQHEIDVIERTNQDRNLKDLQQEAITKKRDKDIIDTKLEYALKEIEIEKKINDDKLKNLRVYFDNSRDAQAAFHLLEAKNELEAAEKAVKALEESDKKLTAQEVADADARVKAAKKAVKDATKEDGPQSLAELLFPNDEKGQRGFNNFIAMLGQVGSAVSAYTNLLVAQYQKQIDAQKQVVTKDNDELTNLQDQLKKEQDLKTKGYANNVDGINKEIAAKNKQRDEDVKKQEDYQKKMEAVQKKALILQAAIQAANLITASTKIFLASSDLGPLGVGISIAAIAAMIAAYVATQKEAFNAVNTGSTTMADGGMVKGKSHAQGGQKFYAPDGSAGIVELEADEFVTKKSQTEKYLPLLQVINDDKLSSMDDRALVNMLSGLGVHLQTDSQHREALSESREFTTHQINQINVINSSPTPAELVSIDNSLKLMLNRSGNTETITEEGDYIVTRKGNYTKKVKK